MLERLLATGGPLDRLMAEGGIVDRLLREGGPLERLLAADGALEVLTAPGGPLDRLLEPEGPLDRLVAEGGLLEQVLITDGTVERLVHPEGTMNRLLATDGTLDRLLEPGGPLEQLTGPEGQLAQLVRLSESIESLAGPGADPAPAGRERRHPARLGADAVRGRGAADPAGRTAARARAAQLSAVTGADPAAGGLRALLAAFLDPDHDEQSGAELSRAVSLVLTAALVITNLVGAAVVLGGHLPGAPAAPGRRRRPPAAPERDRRRGLHRVRGHRRRGRPAARCCAALTSWLARATGRPTPRSSISSCAHRCSCSGCSSDCGSPPRSSFGLIDSLHAVRLGLVVAATIALTGVTTGGLRYLLAERILRKPASRALADEDPGRLRVPGVATRAVLAWAFGTGVPVLGSVVVGIAAAAGSPATEGELERVMIVLGVIAVLVGLLAVSLAARATADPVDAVREAMERVQSGSFDVRVPIYDGTQIGRLQLGFNRMAAGLAERERIRSTFGSYVDEDVADRILEGDVELGGEEVDVTIMFLDVRGFTAFAERTEARDVVTALNALFEQVIPIIHGHGGRVDKFVGDGLLAVFGTPKRLENHADAALDAAREILGALEDDDPLEIGMGINSGRVVAGNLGGAGRLEYGVIGDPVNVAARVQAHTRETGDALLITQDTRERLSRAPEDLHERDGVTLRGRSEPIALYGR